MINHNEKENEKNVYIDMYINCKTYTTCFIYTCFAYMFVYVQHIQLNHFAEQQKLTQHCKSTIYNLKKKKALRNDSELHF